MTHNWGKVDGHHTTHDRELRVSWLGLQFKVGEQVIKNSFEPFRVEKGESIKPGFSERNRTFKMGELVQFSAHDLSEICLTYLWLAERTTQSLHDYLKKLGIEGP